MPFPKFNKESFMDYIKTTTYFFEDPDKNLQEDLKKIEESKDYISWIQSFSKKIVVITFFLYLVVNIIILIIAIMQTKMGTGDINTIYSEINETFRIVIGGYLIKAGVENAFKISGNYLVGVSDAKLKALKEQLGLNNEEENNEEEYDEESSEEITSDENEEV